MAKKIVKISRAQRKIINFIKEGGTLKVKAFAGTGKTTTLVFLAEENIRLRILYLVFGKANEVDAIKKFPRNTRVKTTHALALQYLRYHSELDLSKIRKGYKAKEIADLYDCDIELAQYAIHVFENFCNSSSHTFFEFIGDDDVIELPKKIFSDMVNGKIAITHDFYLKFFHLSIIHNGPPRLNFDIAMIDEAQDTNMVTLDIFLRLNIKTKIYVGDENQQIFAFRGSRDIMKMVDSEELPLLETFRFNQDIADISNKLLKRFKDEKFEIKTKVKKDLKKIDSVCYISRTNSKLIQTINELISDDIKFKTIRKPEELFQLIEEVFYLANNRKKEIKNNFFLKRFKDLDDLTDYAEAVDDVELKSTIKTYKEFGIKIFNFRDIAQKYFDAKGDDIKTYLSTAHVSKGLEWDKVILTDDFPEFTKNISKTKYKTIKSFRKNINSIDPLIVNEFNLFYVAMTRAKQELEILSSNKEFLEINETDLNTSIREAHSERQKKEEKKISA
jgi:superfamily I DNA/RNA helicase